MVLPALAAADGRLQPRLPGFDMSESGPETAAGRFFRHPIGLDLLS